MDARMVVEVVQLDENVRLLVELDNILANLINYQRYRGINES
jgi:hypothetical protein